MKMICPVCDWVYELPEGQTELPADFECELCGAGPEAFEIVAE